MGLLCLSRLIDEEIAIGDDIRVLVVDIRGDRVRLGIEAPHEVPVNRLEVYKAILRQHKVDRIDRLPLAKQLGRPVSEIPVDAASRMARNILATTVEHSGTHAMRAVCAELLRMKGLA